MRYEILADKGVTHGQVTGRYYEYEKGLTVEAPEGEFDHTEAVVEASVEAADKEPSTDEEEDEE